MPGSPPFASPVVKADIDKNTLLCLACSSSLPPSRKAPPLPSSNSISTPQNIFTTPCCQRLICHHCITKNPRLQRYDPCLACLGGIGVVCSSPLQLGSTPYSGVRPNFDGSVRDEDMFVLGEDDSDYEDEKAGSAMTSSAADESSPRPTEPQITLPMTVVEEQAPPEDADASRSSLPLKYYITRSDTLQGIILRYRLDGHELCRLNNLPPSTLRTTPHLLHTRRHLILPPSARKTGLPVNTETPEQEAAREASRGKERAEKRLQTLIKEVDWRVAKAYVAIADDPVEEVEEQEEWERKRKELGRGSTVRRTNLEERAIQRYLDDDEWEENQRRYNTSTVGNVEKIENNSRRWW